jgi:hypothetical protein
MSTIDISPTNPIDGDATDITTADAARSRRSLLGKGAAVAAVAAVAGMSSSQQVQAADGDVMHVGETDTGTSTTKLTGGSTFWVENGNSTGSASLYGTQGGSDGASGVHGRHTGTSGVGVRGEATGSSGRGVYGKSTGSAASAVYGEHVGGTAPGTGVRGKTDIGAGVIGIGTTYDVQADGNGRVGLTKAGNTGSPAASGTLGTIARDAAGNLWYCYATNLWQRIGGPGIAGGFHAIAPIRAFDSRVAATPGSGVFVASVGRVISIKDGRDQTTGAVTAANAIPVGAKAISFNVTAVETTAPSFLAVVPGDVASTDVSSLNWTGPGAIIGNASTVGVDGTRSVRIIAGPGGTFHAVIDVNGYYL